MGSRGGPGTRGDGGQVCRGNGVSDHTFYRWRQQYGGLRIDQARRLREMEAENAPSQACSGRSDVGQPDAERGCRGKLLSPSRRRQCSEQVREVLGVSERRVCKVLGHLRFTRRYEPIPVEDEQGLTEDMVELASRYGYRRITALLRRRG